MDHPDYCYSPAREDEEEARAALGDLFEAEDGVPVPAPVPATDDDLPY